MRVHPALLLSALLVAACASHPFEDEVEVEETSSAFAPQGDAPTPAHPALAQLAGEWEGLTAFAFQDGEMPLRQSARLELGGKWLVTRHHSGAYEGMSLLGWDAEREQFVRLWIDSMDTPLAPAFGAWDAETKTLTLYEEGEDLAGQPARLRETIRLNPDGTLVNELHSERADGGWTAMMVTSSRPAN